MYVFSKITEILLYHKLCISLVFCTCKSTYTMIVYPCLNPRYRDVLRFASQQSLWTSFPTTGKGSLINGPGV